MDKMMHATEQERRRIEKIVDAWFEEFFGIAETTTAVLREAKEKLKFKLLNPLKENSL